MISKYVVVVISSKTKIEEIPGEENHWLEDAISPGMIPRRTTAENRSSTL